MPDWIKEYWVKWLFGIVGTGILSAWAWCKRRASRMSRLEKRQENMEVALRAVSYDKLYYLHGRFYRQGWISVADLKNAEGIYRGYHALGGNGTGTKLFEDLQALPNYPTSDEQQQYI